MPGVGPMSHRRRKRVQTWTPWVGPKDPTRPIRERIYRSKGDVGRTSIDATGADAGAIAAIEAFRKAGAMDVRLDWERPAGHEGATDVPTGLEVVWWFRVTFPDRVAEGRSKPTTNHALGILEAAAQILRGGGAATNVDWSASR